jgi:hypothetical protein
MTNTKKIKELNNLCRQTLGIPVFGSCQNQRHVMTQGITTLSPTSQIEIMAKVRNFDDFSNDNDPYGEADFGAFDYEGNKIFWKIDYYDNSLEAGSENPADPEKTCRVLTVMLASEY